MKKEPELPLVSIIIPAHNEEEYIEKTLLSIASSLYRNYELIVVCDSCTDNTEQISKKYTHKVYAVNFKNTAEARNFGVSKAVGNIFIFSDADTVCSDNYISSIVASVDDCFDYGCSRVISETGTLWGRFMIGRFNNYFRGSKTFGGNCFVSRVCFLKVEGFDISMTKGEDTDLGERLLKSGAKYIFLKNSYIITSERRFRKYGYLNCYIKSTKDAFLYSLYREKYKKIYRRKNINS